jgi:hypothetical protein
MSHNILSLVGILIGEFSFVDIPNSRLREFGAKSQSDLDNPGGKVPHVELFVSECGSDIFDSIWVVIQYCFTFISILSNEALRNIILP